MSSDSLPIHGSMAYCPYCTQGLPPDARSCPHCGRVLTGDPFEPARSKPEVAKAAAPEAAAHLLPGVDPRLRAVAERGLAKAAAPEPAADEPPGVDPRLRAVAERRSVYTLEAPVCCPHCHQAITTVDVIRLSRTQVAFTSTLPRSGRAIVCPACKHVLSVELAGFP